jgi:transcriptional regulator of acetoin/glycerol metabolism
MPRELNWICLPTLRGLSVQVVIVQRGKFATFDLLARTFVDNPNVRVVWDRRARDRRHSASPMAADRRRPDRRRRSCASWDDQHYVLVNATALGNGLQTVSITPRSADLTATVGDVQDFQQDVELAVRSEVNLLLTGGDPLARQSLAQWVHHWSDRGAGPFVALDRVGSVEWLSGSELACPGQGWIPKANQLEASVDLARGGTLLLEEVADLSWALQTELLHFLERRVTQPRRSQADGSRGARIMAATSYDLLDRIASAQFRPDLFYRLNMIRVALPSGTAQTH